MEGEGMVAVVRGLRDAGLAVTLMDGNRQYTLLPNSLTQPTAAQRQPVTNANASTQQCNIRYSADCNTDTTAKPCDRVSQAIDGRYATMYKTTHCRLNPTSPPVQLTEFPPQRPDVHPGHGNFQVGGCGSGATHTQTRSQSPVQSYRGGLSWPDRGSVCSPRGSHEVDAFANSLRKYPCLSPDRSSEVMERLINYTQAKGLSKTFTRNPSSPSRIPEPASHHTFETKGTYSKIPRSYEPEVTVRKKVEDPPTRDRKKDDHHEFRPMRNFDVRFLREVSKRARDNARPNSNYPYAHPVCPTIKENNGYQGASYDATNNSISVNNGIQAAVKMISKEVATAQRDMTRKTVAVPVSPSSSAGEDNVEGECYFVPSLDITTSLKSIQINFCPSDVTLKPKKSVQTVFSSMDLHSNREKTLIGRRSKSQELLSKVTKEDLKRSLLELIEEVSNCTKSKQIIREQLIRKLFATDRDDNTGDRNLSKREKCHKYASTFCPTACDYVGDFYELVGKLRHCYGDTKYMLRSDIASFRISECRQLDYVLRDWISNLNLRTKDIIYMDKNELLNTIEDKIKELFKNRTKQDFDLKTGIVKIIQDIPIEVNKSYNRNTYLQKLVDVLLRRMKNVITNQQNARIRRRPNLKSRRILTEGDIKEFIREQLLDFFIERDLEICDDILNDLENEIFEVMIDSIDCIRCGHVDDALEETELILQDIGQMNEKQANNISYNILQDFQEMLNHCNFHQTYMILNVNNSSGRERYKNNNIDESIEAITDQDIRENIDDYTGQLCQNINEWLDTLNLPQIQDKGFREVVVNDLAGDIVDRHKYLELHPAYTPSEEDELEVLKYQIFKWINKLVGDDNQETIGNARSLMVKVDRIPVPMLTHPKQRILTSTGEGSTRGQSTNQSSDPMTQLTNQSSDPITQSNNQYHDPMKPCIEETEPCCEENMSPSAQPSSKTNLQIDQEVHQRTGSDTQAPADEGLKSSSDQEGSNSPGSFDQSDQNDQGAIDSPKAPRLSEDLSSSTPRFSTVEQGGSISPKSVARSNQSDQNNQGSIKSSKAPRLLQDQSKPNPRLPIKSGSNSPRSIGKGIQNNQDPKSLSSTKSQSPSADETILISARSIEPSIQSEQTTVPSSKSFPLPSSPTPDHYQSAKQFADPITQLDDKYLDLMKPCLDETGPTACIEENKKPMSPKSTPPVSKIHSDQTGHEQSGSIQASDDKTSKTSPVSHSPPQDRRSDQEGSISLPSSLQEENILASQSIDADQTGSTASGSTEQSIQSDQSDKVSKSSPKAPSPLHDQYIPKPQSLKVDRPGSISPRSIGQSIQIDQNDQDQKSLSITPKSPKTGLSSANQSGSISPRSIGQSIQIDQNPKGFDNSPHISQDEKSRKSELSSADPSGYISTKSIEQSIRSEKTDQGSNKIPIVHSPLQGERSPQSQLSTARKTGSISPRSVGWSSHSDQNEQSPKRFSSASRPTQDQISPKPQLLITNKTEPISPKYVDKSTQSDEWDKSPNSYPAAPRPLQNQISPNPQLATAHHDYFIPPGSFMRSLQNDQVYQNPKTQISPIPGFADQYGSIPQESFGPSPVQYTVPAPEQGEGFGLAQVPYGQIVQVGPGTTGFETGVPNQQRVSKALPTGFSVPYMSTNATPSGECFVPMAPYKQFINDPGMGPVYYPGCLVSSAYTVPYAPTKLRPSPIEFTVSSSCLPGSQCMESSMPLSVRKINEEFDDYVHQWVQQIPIPVNTPIEQQAADKARLAIYNGVWKEVTKMEIDPQIFNNPHFYQDAFDEELEGLMKNLPNSMELENQKPMLKAQLFQKILSMIDQIKSSTAPASYKQQVIQCIENNLPKKKHTGNKEEEDKEEIDKQNLADYYILHTRFKDEDNVKANLHQNTFLKRLNEFLENIKKTHAIDDMDTNAYAIEINNALEKIPTPNAFALREEADDILLGMEVDNWISDLPQKPSSAGPLEKRTVRETIVKKIDELGENLNYNDSAFVTPLKAEMPRYLEKIPLKDGTNVDSMVDELANRIRNLSKFSRPKSVSFQEPRNYAEFSGNMPAASSLLETSQQDGSYYVRQAAPRNWINQNEPVSQDPQWLSLHTTQVPSDLRYWQGGIQNISQPYAQNIPEQMPMPGHYSANGYGAPGQFSGNFQKQLPHNGQPYVQGQYNPNLQGQFTPIAPGPFSSIPPCPFSPVGEIQFCQSVKAGAQAARRLPGGPCCENQACSKRSQIIGPFTQPSNRGPYGPGFGNAYGPGVNTAGASPTPQGPYGQGIPNAYGQGYIATSTPYGNVPRYSVSVPPRNYAEVFPKTGVVTGDQRYTPISGQSPQGTFGPGTLQNVMQPQRPYPSQPRSVPPGPYGQAFPSGQDASLPGYQMYPQGSNAVGPGRPGQQPQDSFGQGFPKDQNGSMPTTQIPNGQGTNYPNQDYSNAQDRSVPTSQMTSQGSQGAPESRSPSVGSHQSPGLAPYNQDQSLGPEANGQVAPNVQNIVQSTATYKNAQTQDPLSPRGAASLTNEQSSPHSQSPELASLKHDQGVGPEAGSKNGQSYNQADAVSLSSRPSLKQQSLGTEATGQVSPKAPKSQSPVQARSGQASPSDQSSLVKPGKQPSEGLRSVLNDQNRFGPSASGQASPNIQNSPKKLQSIDQSPTDKVSPSDQSSLAQSGRVYPDSNKQNLSNIQSQESASYKQDQSIDPGAPLNVQPPQVPSNQSQFKATRNEVSRSTRSNSIQSYQSRGKPSQPYQETIGKPVSSTRDGTTQSGQTSPRDDNKGFSDDHTSVNADAQSSVHSPTLNQTAQSSGPVSAASQVPDLNRDELRQSYIQGIADDAIGINQEPGPSTRSGNGQPSTSHAQKSSQVADTQQPSTVGTGSISPDFCKSIDNSCIRETMDDILCQQPLCQQPYCSKIPCIYPGRPTCPSHYRRRRRSSNQCREQRSCAELDETDTSTDRERDMCRCMKKVRRGRYRRQSDDCQMEYPPCVPVRYPYDDRTRFKNRTVKKGKPYKKNGNTTVPLDTDVREQLNKQVSVQAVCSSIDLKTSRCKYCEATSKSQEEMTRITQKQEIIKRRDISRGDIGEDTSECFEIQSDKVKVKVWGDKLKRLAQKLNKPGGEEKLRMKIEKYLKQVPDQFSDGDDERLEFRKQLPNDIIRKLKKLYINPPQTRNFNVYRMELFKYCSRHKVENLRKAVSNWTNTLNIKKRDYLGRSLRKEDIFKFVTDKLEPVVLARPPSDTEYRMTLTSNIAQIVNELPLVSSNQNKEFLPKITEKLVNDILNVENKNVGTYIQPTIKEIKEFVRDEITFFLEKSRVGISAKRMEYLEAELIDILLDIVYIADIDDFVVDNVATLFKELGKLPDYKAKYFSNLILKDYKEFFFRENYFQFKGRPEDKRPYVNSLLKHVAGMSDLRGLTSFDVYTLRLTDEIHKWISNLSICCEDQNFLEAVINDLATDIVERYKYLLLNPRTKGTEAEELEHLKFQIFKWTNKLVGEGNTIALEHAQELLNAINSVPKPSVQSNSAVESVLRESDKQSDKFNIDVIIDEINDWYRELPMKNHMTQDARINKQLFKVLAQEIEKGLSKNDDGVINREVDKWAEKVFNGKFVSQDIKQLKDRISHAIGSKENDPKHERVLIRSYEDIVDEWIDTVPLAPKKEGLFMNNKNELVHEIAVKICKIQTKIDHLPPEIIEKKLQEELSQWLKKLPLHVKVDKPNCREKYAEKLVKNIQTYNIHGSTRNITKITKEVSRTALLEDAVLVWLRKLPLYRVKSTNGKIHSEAVMKELAHKINKAVVNGDANVEDDIIEHISMIDRRKNDKLIQNMATQLKSHLQKNNLLADLPDQNVEDSVAENIDAWVNNLPLQVSDVIQLEIKKNDFIKSLRRLLSLSLNNSILKKEIIVFMKTLPMTRNNKADMRFLNEEADKLIQTLTTAPGADVSKDIQNKSNEIICQAIKKWADTLPLKSVHCPRELRYFIDDMSSVITTLLVQLDKSNADDHKKRLKREIVKFLRRFPLRQEHSTECHILLMAGDLINTLKEVRMFGEKHCTQLNNVTVGVALENTNTTDEFSIESIKDSDIQQNIESYTRELVQQIGEWFDTLNVPAVHKDGYKEVIMNDLAGDIVDRHKYLELNPYTTLTDEDELEHLKYQIFKWINKLVGEDNLETIEHAEDLMRRVSKIPVPMLVRPQDGKQAESSTIPGQKINQSPGGSVKVMDSPKQVSNPGSTYSPGSGGKFNESSPTPQVNTSAESNFADPSQEKQASCCSQDPPQPLIPAEEGTKEAVYEKYQKIFKAKCDALPIDSSTPESAKLAELAKIAIYNGIVKTFFNLKSDPDIENDYGYFEFMLEEKIEELLDVLPQSDELVKKRHAWKLDILSNAIDMLDELHSLSDRPSFRQRVKNKFNRKFAKDLELEQCFLLQQGFLAELADAYILETNYKEKDPLKASIYRNRLMKKVDDLANHLAKEHNVGFRFFKKEQLSRIAMKVLEQVPIPQKDDLQEEAEEIQLADEVGKWYNGLPTKPLINDTDGVLRKRMIDLLAKKLYDTHKRIKDPSKEVKMKHETSQFLVKRAQLQENQDLNINFMVDDLIDRLKNKWLKEPVDYEEFEKYKPLSSTFAQVDNTEFLSPLIDAATSMRPVQTPGVQAPAGPGYVTPSGPPIQGQAYTPQRTLYGEDGSIQAMRPSIASPSVKSETQTYAENLSTGNQMTNTPYVSQQETRVGIGQVGPSAGYPFQQHASMQGAAQSPMQSRTNGVQEASQFGPQPGQSPLIPNTTYLHGRPNGTPGQVYVAEQGAPMMQGMGPAPNSGLCPNLLPNQAGVPEQQFDQNMPNLVQGPYGPNRLYIPGCQGSRGSSPSDFPGYPGSRGPTPYGAATTVPIGPGPSIDMLDSGYHVKCRCLEAYRRRRRFFDQDGRYKPYDCNY